MHTKLIAIGNSQGLRLPQPLIKQYQLKDTLTLIPTEEGILVTNNKPRQNWAASLKAATTKSSDSDILEFESLTNDWDEKEWEW